jgi:hypothetical protein
MHPTLTPDAERALRRLPIDVDVLPGAIATELLERGLLVFHEYGRFETGSHKHGRLGEFVLSELGARAVLDLFWRDYQRVMCRCATPRSAHNAAKPYDNPETKCRAFCPAEPSYVRSTPPAPPPDPTTDAQERDDANLTTNALRWRHEGESGRLLAARLQSGHELDPRACPACGSKAAIPDTLLPLVACLGCGWRAHPTSADVAGEVGEVAGQQLVAQARDAICDECALLPAALRPAGCPACRVVQFGKLVEGTKQETRRSRHG